MSIFHQTISEEDFRETRLQCSGRFPKEFQSAVEDFDKKAKTTFLLQPNFSLQEKYEFVAVSRVGDHTSTKSLAGIYSVSAVGFDENKTHAIVLVEYLVHQVRRFVVGGDSTFYLLYGPE